MISVCFSQTTDSTREARLVVLDGARTIIWRLASCFVAPIPLRLKGNRPMLGLRPTSVLTNQTGGASKAVPIGTVFYYIRLRRMILLRSDIRLMPSSDIARCADAANIISLFALDGNLAVLKSTR